MRKRLIPLCLMALVVLLAGCHSDGFDQVWLKTDALCVAAGETQVFTYDPLTCQQSFNRNARTFRAFKDDLSDYYVLKLGALPSEEGQRIENCDIEWTTSNDVKKLKGITFIVEKVDTQSGKVWLWYSAEKVVVIAQLL